MVGRPQLKMTLVAGQAMDFATSFNAFFAAGLRGPVHHSIDLTKPAGPSTEGGKLALQHVRLLPADGGLAIVVGALNGVEKTAELRTFAALAEVHLQRFRKAIPIDRAAFDAFARDLKTLLEQQGFKVTLIDAAPAIGGAGGSSAGKTVLVVLLVLVLLAGAAVAWLRAAGLMKLPF